MSGRNQWREAPLATVRLDAVVSHQTSAHALYAVESDEQWGIHRRQLELH